MSVFFTSDTHFEHANVIRYDHRPFQDLECMHDAMSAMWNHAVGKKDDVWILGDFAYKNSNKWISALNGRKHLVLGNHDHISQINRRNFSTVQAVKMLVVNGQQIWLSHYRHQTWPGKEHGSWHFYGHSHGRIREYEDQLAIAVDVAVWDWHPVALETLAMEMHRRMANWKFRAKGDPDELQRIVEENRERNRRAMAACR